MFDNYEKFKKDVYALTKIDLNYYKEKQMRRRIDTIATKHGGMGILGVLIGGVALVPIAMAVTTLSGIPL